MYKEHRMFDVRKTSISECRNLHFSIETRILGAHKCIFKEAGRLKSEPHPIFSSSRNLLSEQPRHCTAWASSKSSASGAPTLPRSGPGVESKSWSVRIVLALSSVFPRRLPEPIRNIYSSANLRVFAELCQILHLEKSLKVGGLYSKSRRRKYC